MRCINWPKCLLSLRCARCSLPSTSITAVYWCKHVITAMHGHAAHAILGSQACGQPWEHRSDCLHNFRTQSSPRSAVSTKQFSCAYDTSAVLPLQLPDLSDTTLLLNWWSEEIQRKQPVNRSLELHI
jgi:hypothetical protein